MKIKCLFLLLFILLFSLNSFAEEPHEWYEGYMLEPYYSKSKSPLIIDYPGEFYLDLTKNRIAARGEYPITGLLTNQNRLSIEEKAKNNALNNLIELLGNLRVDKIRRVSDLTKESLELKEAIKKKVKSTSKIIHYRIFTMKRVLRVTASTPYKGLDGIANLIYDYLDKESSALTLESDENSQAMSEEVFFEEESPTPYSQKIFDVPIYGSYTGLIVDSKGLKLEPALDPKILDEDGVEIYGPSRKFNLNLLYKKGKIEYFSSLSTAKADQRAGKNPLIIKALKSDNGCDIIVSAQDGYRIIEENKKTRFLEKLNVIIII